MKAGDTDTNCSNHQIIIRKRAKTHCIMFKRQIRTTNKTNARSTSEILKRKKKKNCIIKTTRESINGHTKTSKKGTRDLKSTRSSD